MREEAFIQHEMGHLDARVWEPMQSYYTLILASPAGKHVWELRKEHFDGDFRDFVGGLEIGEYSLNG